MSTWRFTNDPNDPCPYCVSWVDPLNPDDNPEGEHSYDPDDFIPYGPNAAGELVTVDRIYDGAHAECQAAVAAYLDDREHA